MVARLVSESLGEYVHTLPVDVITGAGQKVGGTSSEIAQLKSVRVAYEFGHYEKGWKNIEWVHCDEPEKDANPDVGIKRKERS